MPVTCTSFQHVAHLVVYSFCRGIERSEVETLRASREKERTRSGNTFLAAHLEGRIYEAPTLDPCVRKRVTK